MHQDEHTSHEVMRISRFASQAFLKIDVFTYLVLGLMWSAAALLGIGTAGVSV